MIWPNTRNSVPIVGILNDNFTRHTYYISTTNKELMFSVSWEKYLAILS